MVRVCQATPRIDAFALCWAGGVGVVTASLVENVFFCWRLPSREFNSDRQTYPFGTELCAVKVCLCVHKRQQRGGVHLWLALLLSALFCIVLNGCVPHVTILLTFGLPRVGVCSFCAARGAHGIWHHAMVFGVTCVANASPCYRRGYYMSVKRSEYFCG